MAISAPHYHCLKELHRRGELPRGGALLEIGEANWYGDIPPPFGDYRAPDTRLGGWEVTWQADSFRLVKRLYADLFGNPQVSAIDFHGPTAEKKDLNLPITTINGSLFDTVINHGTCEHIFNIGQVYQTMHDCVRVGGLLIHESPFTGWIDHGFYTIQPTLYFDLAAANQYKIVYMAVTHIEHGSAVEIHSREQILKMAAAGGVANNSMLYVAMRKTADEPFKIPMQGFYAQSISEEASHAWREMR